MSRLFPLPFYNFCKNAYYCGGFSGKGLLHAFPWFIKTTLLEPLRWIELAKYNSKIETYKIAKQPLFILGYYRSGTTYLQQLLTQDDRFGYLSNFQTVFPELMLSFEKSLKPMLEWVTQLSGSQEHFHRVRLNWNAPGEEDVAMFSLACSIASETGVLFPQKTMEFFRKYTLFENVSHDQVQQWMNTYIYLIKKISVANGHKPLILKSPPNTARIKLLLELFPDAKFIYISRDPVSVYASSKRIWEVIRKKYAFGRFSKVDTGKIIFDSYTAVIDRYLEHKRLIMPERLMEICYEDFIRQPVETVENIYQTLKLGDFNYCRESMNTYAARQQSYKVLDHRLLTDELNTIEVKLAPYIGHWRNIQAQTQLLSMSGMQYKGATQQSLP